MNQFKKENESLKEKKKMGLLNHFLVMRPTWLGALDLWAYCR
jgi:hypothetical protein